LGRSHVETFSRAPQKGEIREERAFYGILKNLISTKFKFKKRKDDDYSLFHLFILFP